MASRDKWIPTNDTCSIAWLIVRWSDILCWAASVRMKVAGLAGMAHQWSIRGGCKPILFGKEFGRPAKLRRFGATRLGLLPGFWDHPPKLARNLDSLPVDFPQSVVATADRWAIVAASGLLGLDLRPGQVQWSPFMHSVHMAQSVPLHGYHVL